MGRLADKVALITGAGQGHGAGLARRFAQEGAAVAMCDIMPLEQLEAGTGAAARAYGGQVRCFQADVSQEDQVIQMVEQTLEHFGTIDILANVVGIAGPTKDIWQMALAEWKKTLDVNLDSIFLCSKAVLPTMIQKRSGRVINFSSGSGKQPLAHRTPYVTSKMGVIGFTRTLAADVGRYNITVNAICPGIHEERSLELAKGQAEYRGEPFDEAAFRADFRTDQQDDRRVLAGRWATEEGYLEKTTGPDDAAAIALFLASEDGANITGQDINSGGWVMW